MDKSGYKRYLQSLGNQKHYIGSIQKLVELEQELNIDLDDYIPYDEEYSKVDKLDAILHEPLFSSINSYMRYRLSGFSENETEPSNNSPTCSNSFVFNGSEGELKAKLSIFISEADSQRFINGLKDFSKYLGDDEFIKETVSYPGTQPGMMQFLLKSSNYNINIKAITLTTVALLLDIKLTIGFMSTILAITGFNSQAIAKVDVSEGEKCLIMEAMQANNHIIDENIFSNCNSECIHNNLNCKYRINDDKCSIDKEDIKRTLDELCEKNIFRKINDLYKYNF